MRLFDIKRAVTLMNERISPEWSSIGHSGHLSQGDAGEAPTSLSDLASKAGRL